jgi:hypothetical protein
VLYVALASGLAAQSIDIRSEFQRVDPYGEIVSADRAVTPREILSPAVARNAWASFHIVVTAPRNTSYLLYVVTNPIDACRVALFKEHFVRSAVPSGPGWVPDALTELQRLPDFGAIPDPDDLVPDQTTRLYLLDLWIPPDVSPGRFRLEVQLKAGDWVVRPMEVRVLPARVPDLSVSPDGSNAVKLPPLESGADAAAMGPLFGAVPHRYPKPVTVRGIIQRNAVQDMLLARSLNIAPEDLRRFWVQGAFPRVLGAEWYLRLRDSLLRGAR